MADRVGDSAELREQIVEGYKLMGCPPERAVALTDNAFAAHNAVEAARGKAIAEAITAFDEGDADINQSLVLLIVQLELAHLNHVFDHLRQKLGLPGGGEGETVQ